MKAVSCDVIIKQADVVDHLLPKNGEKQGPFLMKWIASINRRTNVVDQAPPLHTCPHLVMQIRLQIDKLKNINVKYCLTLARYC
jgi:hypothetical protein